LDPNFRQTLLQWILTTVNEEGYPYNAIPLNMILKALEKDGFDRRIVRHCLNSFSSSCKLGE